MNILLKNWDHPFVKIVACLAFGFALHQNYSKDDKEKAYAAGRDEEHERFIQEIRSTPNIYDYFQEDSDSLQNQLLQPVVRIEALDDLKIQLARYTEIIRPEYNNIKANLKKLNYAEESTFRWKELIKRSDQLTSVDGFITYLKGEYAKNPNLRISLCVKGSGESTTIMSYGKNDLDDLGDYFKSLQASNRNRKAASR